MQEEEGRDSRLVDGYDRSVRELQFERRGQALDRLKTEEEIVREEKERLEKLEVRCENVMMKRSCVLPLSSG